MRSIKFLLILMPAFYAVSARAATAPNTSPQNQNEDLATFEQNATQLDVVHLFDDSLTIAKDGSVSDIWQSGDYIVICGDETIAGYDFSLFFNKNENFRVYLPDGYTDIVDFMVYFYQSTIENYPYKVVLIEGCGERAAPVGIA